MLARRIFIATVSIILVGAVFAGMIQALEPEQRLPETVAALSNVRDYASAPTADSRNYAVDGGRLFAGGPLNWTEVPTPQDIVIGAVAIDAEDSSRIYIGAANELAIYRSTNEGQDWLRVPLSDSYVGGVTDMAVDGLQRLIYVGTDTAGLFRLRDVGSSVILGGQLLLDEPVLEVVADSTGRGLAFARTEWHLYRAENFGLSWVEVNELHSAPTALAISNSPVPVVYVGTLDRGLLKSDDGITWSLANEGLGFVPGSRLSVDALAVDPLQPDVLYVATSYLLGSTQVHRAPVGVAMSVDGAQAWSTLDDSLGVAVAGLLPVSGETGAVYALTTESRAPLALGSAPDPAVQLAASAEAGVVATEPIAAGSSNWTELLAWVIAGFAAIALVFAIASDLLRTRRQVAGQAETVPEHVNNNA